MLGGGEDSEGRPAAGRDHRKIYSRSVSWAAGGASPPKSTTKSLWNSKVRSCLPPLQPLSVSRPKAEEWPGAGSDDLGVWPNVAAATAATTPGVRPPREFEFRKDKLAFYDKECSRITDHVFLGSDAVAKDRGVLRRHGVTHVLNCVGFVCPEYFKGDLVYKTLWLRDSPSEDITSVLYDVFDYLEDVQERGGRVLVHCCQGVSRSTSLVIAYLMWREGRGFEDAFRRVKAARGVTDPNMGFACQLLQCQKRVHAAPVSPNSVLRMYRMAPHSSYAPLHLVPKMLTVPNGKCLDSRGAFIVHVLWAIYVWVGKNCVALMSESAGLAASQVVRYEKANGPVLRIREGEEPVDFWSALGDVEDGGVPGERKTDEYDLDFGIFDKAANGGVVPPLAMSGKDSEMRVPARQSGWERLRRKFVAGVVKELIMNPDTVTVVDSPDSLPFSGRSNWVKSTRKEEGDDDSGCPSPTSFSSFLVKDATKFDSTSPLLSPSTSDYSKSFTFSPTSSSWSDLSLASPQPSPSKPSTAQGSQTRKNLAKTWSFSLEDQSMEEAEEGIIAQDDREETMVNDYYDLSEGNTETGSFFLYQWPTMAKLETNSLSIPDSRSVYIIYGIKKPNVLYIWVGRDVCDNGDDDSCNCKEWEAVGLDFLARKGLATSSLVQIVREGEEPEELLKHLHCFSFQKTAEKG